MLHIKLSLSYFYSDAQNFTQLFNLNLTNFVFTWKLVFQGK